MDIADADYGRIEGSDIAADDALQAEHEMGLGIGDVGREMRLGAAMSANAPESHGPAVGCRQHRPVAGSEARGCHARRVVQAVDGIAGEALEQPVLQHRDRTAATFLGRLEDQVQRAAEIGIGGEIAGRAEQHGGVPVMTAGMHPAGMA